MEGNLIRQLCNLLQIIKNRTPPYHPSSNGQVERYNRTISQAIRGYVRNKQDYWDQHLQQLAGAIKLTKNPQTGFSSNILILGRDVYQPLNVILGSPKLDVKNAKSPGYVKDLTQTLEDVHALARDQLKATQDTKKRVYDLKNNQNQYNVGDIVYKLNQATKLEQSVKLKTPWKGPYLITSIRPPVFFFFFFYKNKDSKSESWIHHDRLKAC